MTKLEVLKTYYGYDSFRGGQERVINALLSGRDALAIMPTGAGKSICYQVPALMLPGITLVISPLVSLMRDQVTQLVQMGIPAAFLNSSLTHKQYLLALERAKEGRYKIIYVAPERLETEGFRAFAETAEISMVAVDEAHCISQWGQDFRPSYLKIRSFVVSLRKRPVLGAFTATATKAVREDILKLLRLENPVSVTTGFNRENLYFEVRQPQDKKAELLRLVREKGTQCMIVYCATRKNVEEVCTFLQERGFPATRYHAGLEQEERQRNQEDFLFDRARIMVATNAFGMGIDKSNVRCVIHYNMPKDLESYYQEAGRAGRDGLASACVLLFSGRDVALNEFLIDHSEPNAELDAETAARLRERDYRRLQTMTAYCRRSTCLRQYILQYFGETAPNDCGNCSNCLRNFEERDISREARIILQCVQETGETLGIGVLADVLCGYRTAGVRKLRMEQEPSFGVLAELPAEEVRRRIEFLLEEGILKRSGGPYPVVQLGLPAEEILRGGETYMRTAKTRQSAAAKTEKVLDGQQMALLRRLMELRASQAKLQGVPAYAVFSDQTLRELARTRPRTLQAFRAVSGVGYAKADRYGMVFLAEIENFGR